MGIANLERKGQFIINNFSYNEPLIQGIYQSSNSVLDKILRDYDEYLIKHKVCPHCYGELAEPDTMFEQNHCHSCNWLQEYINFDSNTK